MCAGQLPEGGERNNKFPNDVPNKLIHQQHNPPVHTSGAHTQLNHPTTTQRHRRQQLPRNRAPTQPVRVNFFFSRFSKVTLILLQNNLFPKLLAQLDQTSSPTARNAAVIHPSSICVRNSNDCVLPHRTPAPTACTSAQHPPRTPCTTACYAFRTASPPTQPPPTPA